MTRETIQITYSAFGDLVSTVGINRPETGGLLLGSREDGIIRKFVFDEWGSQTRTSYDPNPAKLNPILKSEWQDNRLALVGWAHSHPFGISRLSGDYGGNTGDVGFLRAIFHAMPSLERFIVPILFSGVEGALTVHPYIVERSKEEKYRMGTFEPIPDSSAIDPWKFEESVSPEEELEDA